MIVNIRNTDLVIAGMYIPPNNSVYYKDIYFDNLRLIKEYFKDQHLIVIGDLNSRIGNIEGKLGYGYNYVPNPDITINDNGKNLKDICSTGLDFTILNGLSDGIKTFDSKYTFYKGKARSQVVFWQSPTKLTTYSRS